MCIPEYLWGRLMRENFGHKSIHMSHSEGIPIVNTLKLFRERKIAAISLHFIDIRLIIFDNILSRKQDRLLTRSEDRLAIVQEPDKYLKNYRVCGSENMETFSHKELVFIHNE
ncbi:hypothetical protein RF11_15093 [Thelohanellus kitauei]|uniref:Uncharacterized protein n=1 Tax=Thelohanellus kitauei TaxID=669202 RepID=A0A0C2J1A8_THEKT|nr:hypothetical protein RF11_15093 [Thelohanellus kitauei]